jgi:hypothetical protein
MLLRTKNTDKPVCKMLICDGFDDMVKPVRI